MPCYVMPSCELFEVQNGEYIKNYSLEKLSIFLYLL